MPETLTIPAESSALLIVEMVKHLEFEDLEQATNACLSARSYRDFETPSPTRPKLLAEIFKSGANEGWLFDFIGRAVESAWSRHIARSALLTALPLVVRPAAGFDSAPAINDIGDAVSVAISRTGTDSVFLHRATEHRLSIQTIPAVLERLAAAKDLHDGLHAIQIKSQAWLDAFQEQRPPLAGLISDLKELLVVLDGVKGRIDETLRARVERSMTDAHRRLEASAGPEDIEAQLAYDTIKAVLRDDQPLANDLLLASFRALPVRALFDALDPASGSNWPEAMRALVDDVRRKLLAHGLWQEVDRRLYRLEQLFFAPPADFIASLIDEWTAIRQAINALVESQPGKPTTDDVELLRRTANDLAEQLLMATEKSNEVFTADIVALRDDLSEAIHEFAWAVRSRFYMADNRLKHDCTALLSLRGRLDAFHRAIVFGG